MDVLCSLGNCLSGLLMVGYIILLILKERIQIEKSGNNINHDTFCVMPQIAPQVLFVSYFMLIKLRLSTNNSKHNDRDYQTSKVLFTVSENRWLKYTLKF